MLSNFKKNYLQNLYIFFVLLSLIIFFFSTDKVYGKAFEIENIEISRPFEMNFNKNKVIDEGFEKAFLELVSLITKTSDRNKIKKIKLNEIKSMVETFSIKEEKFIDEIYYLNLGVSFSRKKIFDYLEEKNIFPSIPIKKTIFFVPIIINENTKDLMVFSDNEIYNNWNKEIKNFHLIKYILPTEDLEDLDLLKKKYENIEQYDFKEIVNKYNLDDSIITLIFINEKEIRTLSRISIQNNLILKNQSFSNTDINNLKNIKEIINSLKTVYENYWKSYNQINTSIKLTINIKISGSNNSKIMKFEKLLSEIDLVYDYYIVKFDKNYSNYQIIFNGTPKKFLETMNKNDYNLNTDNKVWIIK